MKLAQRIRQGIVGYVTFPLTNSLYNRRAILSRYKRMIQTELYPQEQLREIQLNKLKQVISHAYHHVPFYRQRFKDMGMEPGDIKNIEDLNLIPPLTRQDVINHHKDMVAHEFQASISAAEQTEKDPGTPISFAVFTRDKLVRNTSSGSTGAPTVFYEDGTRTAINWAHELRLKHWFGLNPGAREARA